MSKAQLIEAVVLTVALCSIRFGFSNHMSSHTSSSKRSIDFDEGAQEGPGNKQKLAVSFGEEPVTKKQSKTSVSFRGGDGTSMSSIGAILGVKFPWLSKGMNDFTASLLHEGQHLRMANGDMTLYWTKDQIFTVIAIAVVALVLFGLVWRSYAKSLIPIEPQAETLVKS